MATNKDAVIFNSYAPSWLLYGLNKLDYDANMTSYEVDGEILSSTIGKVLRLPGEHIILDKEDDRISVLKRFIALMYPSLGIGIDIGTGGIKESIDKHLASSIEEALENETKE